LRAAGASDGNLTRSKLNCSVHKNSDTIIPIDSTARIGETVARRRFQKGSVFLNKTKTLWLGMYAEYVLDANGVERRERKQVTLSLVKIIDATGVERKVTKREAQKLLQPYVDRVNSALSAPIRERKTATFEAFVAIWERDYLSLSKPSTQSGAKSYRLKLAFGKKEMRQIDAGDLQRVIAGMSAEGLNPKTIRNLWGVASLIWSAALAQKYVNAMLPKPKLPRKLKQKPKIYTLAEVGKMITASPGEHRLFYWLLAELGVRAGEIAGMKLTDIEGEKLTINQSIWNGDEQTPKSDSSEGRVLALSPQIVSLLWEQIVQQKAKGHEFLFSASTGSPVDMNTFRSRKLRKRWASLGIQQEKGKAFHAFRHFNAALMDALCIPLKVRKERIGHAYSGDFTLDVYGGKPDWSANVDAAKKLGEAIEQAVREAEQVREQAAQKSEQSTQAENFVSLTAINGNGLQTQNL
jgi:integrase